ncbi:hypothetical protein AOLI_G00201290 [Acnodon oligacanthus]
MPVNATNLGQEGNGSQPVKLAADMDTDQKLLTNLIDTGSSMLQLCPGIHSCTESHVPVSWEVATAWLSWGCARLQEGNAMLREGMNEAGLWRLAVERRQGVRASHISSTLASSDSAMDGEEGGRWWSIIAAVVIPSRAGQPLSEGPRPLLPCCSGTLMESMPMELQSGCPPELEKDLAYLEWGVPRSHCGKDVAPSTSYGTRVDQDNGLSEIPAVERRQRAQGAPTPLRDLVWTVWAARTADSCGGRGCKTSTTRFMFEKGLWGHGMQRRVG